MNKKEILEYNKRCAEFLRWKLLNTLNNKFKNHYETTNIHFGLKLENLNEMRFHSDWNWIMKVVEAIKDLKETIGSGKGTRMVTKFDITNTSVTIAFENGNSYYSIYVSHTDNGRYFKMEGDVDTVKEAVVQAINQFLIWYNETKL